MECPACASVLTGEPTCPTCGTPFTLSREGRSIPAVIDELEARLAKALEGRYELRGVLGHGGMGVVFLAAELRLDRLVAIKLLPPNLSTNDELLTRFDREAKTAARLDHPGIVPIYAVEEVDGLHFFAMKFVPGRHLGDVIGEGPISAGRAREILWDAAMALGHAHGRGVIHRDVKPGNIMIDRDGRTLLTDFGIAKAMSTHTQMTSTGQMLGTPQYMSPEQLQDQELTGRADQYALGMVAYHMLTGKAPFDQSSVAVLLVKQLNEDPEPLGSRRPDLPPSMVEAVERAIRKDPEERFESMEAFAEALWAERADSGGSSRGGSPTSTRTPLPPSRGGGRRFLAGIGAIAALAVVGFLGWQALGPEPESGPPASLPAEGGGIGVQAPTEAGSGDEDSEASVQAESGGPEAQRPGGEAGVPSPPPSTETSNPTVAGSRPPADPETPSTPTAALGFLTLNAEPVFAYVEIDGVELPNSTPIFEHALEPGTHIVTVRREGYETIVDTVQITAGNVTRRNHVLIKR